MGQITLPTAGRVYLDAQVVSYFAEHHPEHHPRVAPLWDPAVTRARLVTSELALMEAVVRPLADGDAARADVYEQVIGQSCELVPVGPAVLRRAAELRAGRPALRTPDAIHIASAQLGRVDIVLTNDKRLLASVAPLPTIYVGDLPPP